MARCCLVLVLLSACLIAAAGAAATQSELVISRGGDKEYHRPGCERIKDGKGVLALTRAQATDYLETSSSAAITIAISIAAVHTENFPIVVAIEASSSFPA